MKGKFPINNSKITCTIIDNINNTSTEFEVLEQFVWNEKKNGKLLYVYTEQKRLHELKENEKGNYESVRIYHGIHCVQCIHSLANFADCFYRDQCTSCLLDHKTGKMLQACLICRDPWIDEHFFPCPSNKILRQYKEKNNMWSEAKATHKRINDLIKNDL